MNGRPHAKNNRHENAEKKQVERNRSSHRNLPPTGPNNQPGFVTIFRMARVYQTKVSDASTLAPALTAKGQARTARR